MTSVVYNINFSCVNTAVSPLMWVSLGVGAEHLTTLLPYCPLLHCKLQYALLRLLRQSTSISHDAKTVCLDIFHISTSLPIVML